MLILSRSRNIVITTATSFVKKIENGSVAHILHKHRYLFKYFSPPFHNFVISYTYQDEHDIQPLEELHFVLISSLSGNCDQGR